MPYLLIINNFILKSISILLLFIATSICFSQKPQQGINELQAEESDFIRKINNQLAVDKYIDNQLVLLEKGEVKQAITFGFEKTLSFSQTYPYQVGIAQSGDLGYTLSVWKNISQTPSTGTNLKIWRKTNAKWKVILQMNVAHPMLNMDCYNSYLPIKPTADFDLSKNKTLGAEQLVFMKDYYYIKNAKTSPNPFEPSLSNEVLIIEENIKPIAGKESSDKYLKVNFSKTEIQTVFKAISSTTGDLAIVYGTTQTKTSKGNFLRIWREEAKDNWKIVVDLKIKNDNK